MFNRALLNAMGVCLTGLATSGCDLLEAANATTIVGGFIVRTPELSITDIIDVPAEVVATAYVGERDSPTSTATPTPIGTAQVSVSFSGRTVALPVQDAPAGLYGESSTRVTMLEYEGGAEYTLEADLNGSRFGGLVTAPPALSAAAITLDPNPTMAVPGFPEVLVHTASTALTLTWGDQFGRYAYVSVFRADPNDPSNPDVVFDNQPETASELLNFILGTPPPNVTIPGDVFAQDGLYAVVLFTMNNTDDLLPDTFIGSPILVGSGAATFLAVGQFP